MNKPWNYDYCPGCGRGHNSGWTTSSTHMWAHCYGCGWSTRR